MQIQTGYPMSIKVYFSKYSPLWDEAQLNESLAQMPVPIREKIAAYQNPADRQSRVQGKLLLIKMINDFGLTMKLEDMKYTSYHKPYFDGDLDFSISHCDGMVICAGGLMAKIGIDTEPIREINVDDYIDELTVNERYLIHHNQNPSKTFLQVWTKKEALLKATGRGIDMDMSYLDVSSNMITVHREQFSLYAIPSDEAFVSHIAVTGPHTEIKIQEVEW
jgi:4'-phosphopantetheinyl transferase